MCKIYIYFDKSRTRLNPLGNLLLLSNVICED